MAIVQKAAKGIRQAEKELLTSEMSQSEVKELLQDLEFFSDVGAKAAKEAQKIIQDVERKVTAWQKSVYATH